MRSISILLYIEFGICLQFLKDSELNNERYRIIEKISDFLIWVDELDLKVTQRAVYKLEKFLDELIESDLDELTDVEASILRELMRDFSEIIFAETAGHKVFIVLDKRYDVNKLISNIPTLMSPNVFDSLPDIAQYDFKEAGKCIAFERPTAAACLLLRGTEAVLRHFYCSFVKRNRVKKLLWGPMTEHLRTRRKKIPEVLLNNLDNIRRSFRNPTQHPEKIFDIEEVQDLFGLCIDVVNRMIGLL